MRLTADRIRFAYRPGRDVLHEVSLTVAANEILFVLGANGSGKSTLLDCLAGIRVPQSGDIWIDDRPLGRLSARERAKRIGMVPQLHEPVFAFTVTEAVLMGRTPHLGPFSRPADADRRAVEEALRAVDIFGLRDRPYTGISGGERQLVLIARGLAQGASCLLMDEPAAHLDPRHRADVLDAVRRLSRDGLAFVITSHQPDSALLFADRIAFLIEGRSVYEGPPAQAITPETLRAAYGMEFEIVASSSGARSVIPRISSPDRRFTE
jgi:iron complex transport system ATP-binding protein